MEKVFYRFLDYVEFWGITHLGGAFLFVLALGIFIFKRQFKLTFNCLGIAFIIMVPASIIWVVAWMWILNIGESQYIAGSLIGFVYLVTWVIVIPSGGLVFTFATALLSDAFQLLSFTRKNSKKIAIAIGIITLMFTQYHITTVNLLKSGYSKKTNRNTKKDPPVDWTKSFKKGLEKVSVSPWGKASDHIHVFSNLVKTGRYDEALSYLDNLNQSDEDIDRGWLNAATSDEVVKLLYMKGDLRNAIIKKRKSLLQKNIQLINNHIVEFWFLQGKYKERVGEEKYVSDLEVSAQVSSADQEELEKRLRAYQDQPIVFYKNYEPERMNYELAQLEGDYYYGRLHFREAEDAYRKVLELYERMRRQFKTRDIQRDEYINLERLLYVLVIQGKYEDAMKIVKKMISESAHSKDINRDSIATLEKAIQRGIRPSDLAYPQYMLDKYVIKSIQIRDANWNRLDVPDVMERSMAKVQQE